MTIPIAQTEAATLPFSRDLCYRNWCFTYNNPTPLVIKKLQDYAFTHNFVYITWGREVGKKGTFHLQGYCQTKGVRHTTLCKAFPKISFRKQYSKSTNLQCQLYCHKYPYTLRPHPEDGHRHPKYYIPGFEKAGEVAHPKASIYELGIVKARDPGRRSDLITLQEAITDGATYVELLQTQFSTMARYYKFAKEYINTVTPGRDFETKVIVHWGAAGTGKTRAVFDKHPNVLFMDINNSFFTPYHGEEIVVFDDFEPSCMSRRTFLTITDRYPTRINQKGGSTMFKPRIIYFTSNFDPKTWYMNQFEEDDAVARRISKIQKF